MRRLVKLLRPFELEINVLGCALGIYLAASNALKGAQWPTADFWQPWRWAFIAMLAAALFVPLFALYKYLDARFAVLEADLSSNCQDVALTIMRRCPGLDLDNLAVQVWICNEKRGTFDRRSRFFLPRARPPCGVAWRKGVGVVGMAWETGRDWAIDLRSYHARRAELTEEDFDQLPVSERLGMRWVDFENSKRYAWVSATRLVPEKDPRRVIGMLVVDYRGDRPDDLARISTDPAFLNEYEEHVGTIVRRLAGTPTR